MKNTLLITVLTLILLLGASSLAATHADLSDGDNLQSTIPSNMDILIPFEFADIENVEDLLQYINDPDPFVRVEVIQALGEIQEKRSFVAILGCLNDENIYVRAYAADALGKIGTIDVSLTLSKLFPALDDPSPYVRAMIVSALGELQDARAINPLREMLQDKDETVRGMAAWALDNIEKSN